MTTKTTAKKTAATPEKKPRGPADPTPTHMAYKLVAGENTADGEGHEDIVDVVPFGHRAADEVEAMRWAMRRGYLVTTVPPGVSLREHLRTEATS